VINARFFFPTVPAPPKYHRALLARRAQDAAHGEADSSTPISALAALYLAAARMFSRPDLTVFSLLVHTRQVHPRLRRAKAMSKIANWSGIALHKIADRLRIVERPDPNHGDGLPGPRSLRGFGYYELIFGSHQFV